MRRPDELIPDEFDPFVEATGATIWAFYVACYEGDFDAVRALVSAHPRLVHAVVNYHTPLHFALRENHVEIARYLLELGADPSCGAFQYLDLRALLEERGQREALGLLEARHSVSKEGEPLAQAIRDGDLALVGEMLKGNPALVHVGDTRGTLPIHWAVMTRNLALIDLLLDRGAAIDQMRPDGAKAIYLTNGDYYYRGWRDAPAGAMRAHFVLIGYLLAKGAYYDIWTAARLGDLHRIEQELARDPQLLNQLPTYSGFYKGAPLRNAVRHGYLHIARYLLDQGANPNLPEAIAPHGAILRDAIGGEHWEIVELLLERGANPNAMVDSSGNCVWAAKEAPEEIRKLLEAKGGELGLNMACYDKNLEYIEDRLQKNPRELVHPFLPLDDRPTVELVLRYQPDALAQRSIDPSLTIEQAEWLLDRGISPSRPDWLGVTPLHECAKRGNVEMAELLLARGAPKDPVDDHYRETALEWCRRFGRPPIY